MDNVGYDGGPFGLFLLCVFLFGVFLRALIESGCLQKRITVRKESWPKPKPKERSKSKPKPRPTPKPKPKPQPGKPNVLD